MHHSTDVAFLLTGQISLWFQNQALQIEEFLPFPMFKCNFPADWEWLQCMARKMGEPLPVVSHQGLKEEVMLLDTV